MENIFIKLCRKRTKDCSLYETDDDKFVLLSLNHFIFTFYPKNGYTYYRHEFFKDIFRVLSITREEGEENIKKWMEKDFGFKVGENIYPDFLSYKWDFRSDEYFTRMYEEGKVNKNYRKVSQSLH